MQAALVDSGLEPQRIDAVNAHATSTPAGDPVEALALRRHESTATAPRPQDPDFDRAMASQYRVKVAGACSGDTSI